MNPIVRGTMLAGALALALSVSSSHAGGAPRLDLVGTWTGTISCKGFFNGGKDKFTLDPIMRISQGGNQLGIVLDYGAGFTERYAGLANPSATKPGEKGELALVFCGTDDQVGIPPDFDEIGRMSVAAKPDKVKAAFKGLTIFSDFDNPGPLPAGSYTCKWKYTRTDPTPPVQTVGCDS